MTNEPSKLRDDAPLNPATPVGVAQIRELMGERFQKDQSAIVDASEIDSLDAATATELDEGEPSDSLENELPSGGESLEMLTERELRADETDDVLEAIEEGYTYIPPIDPPTTPGNGFENAEVASGFGASSIEEAYTQDTHGDFLPSDDEMQTRVRDALRADSSTNPYAKLIAISVRGGVVTLRGLVDDMVDSDNLLAVAGYVEGVEDVIDELDVKGM